MKRLIPLLLLLSACSSRVHVPDAEALKPAWLKDQPYRSGYYTGIGHSLKDGSNNYIQVAKKSALDDLVSQIKVNVASTSVLSFFETDLKMREEYEQIIKTTAADELQEARKFGVAGGLALGDGGQADGCAGRRQEAADAKRRSAARASRAAMKPAVTGEVTEKATASRR